MDDRVGQQIHWAIGISAVMAILVSYLAYAYIWPQLDLPLIKRIKGAAETQLAEFPGPPGGVLNAIDVASAWDSVAVYAQYRDAQP